MDNVHKYKVSLFAPQLCLVTLVSFNTNQLFYQGLDSFYLKNKPRKLRILGAELSSFLAIRVNNIIQILPDVAINEYDQLLYFSIRYRLQ